jgi:hypothetical protein
MPTPLETTFETFARSRNQAATATLLAALDAPHKPIADGVVRALVRRTSKAGHLAVLERLHKLAPELRRAVDENQGRMGGALRDAVLSPDEQLFANACEVIRESDEFDLAPTLITVAEQSDGSRRRDATALVTGLVNRLLHPVDESEPRRFDRDPDTIRRCVLESLQRSIERFELHQNTELVECFVVLAGPDHPSLRTILDMPRHPCFEPVHATLQHSSSPDVLRLLARFLVGHEAPATVISVVSRRTDEAFTKMLLGLPLTPCTMALEKNLGRIKSFACLGSVDTICKRMSPVEQAASMRMTSLCGAGDEAKLDFAAALLARGAQAARLAACESLLRIAGQRSNDLVLAALADDDADVQAAATRQLRERHIPGAMAKLIQLASSPHVAVQDAARESLAEFSFNNYIARYETLDDEAQRQTGALVARVDLEAPTGIRREMASLVRRHRLRAIEIAELMGLTARVADALIERLDDEDHMVRAAAADALSGCTTMEVRDALLDALGDRSYAVQTAARNSLRAMGVDLGADPGAGASDLQEAH